MDLPGNNPEPELQPPAPVGSYVLKSTFNDCWAELQSVKEAARETEAKAERTMQDMAGLEDHNAYLLSRLQETGNQLTETTQLLNKRTAQLSNLARAAQTFSALVDAKAQVYSKEDRELLSCWYVALKQTYTPHLTL